MPPASPAAIMLVNSGSKVFGCLRIASASDAPDSTSVRVCRITAEKFLSSSWLPRMSRHCTSGRPASIITENCRVNTAKLFALTFLPVFPFFSVFASALPWTGVIFVTLICSRRRAAVAASTVSATRSPDTVWPARVRPEYANVAIRLAPHRRTRGRGARRAPQTGSGDDADAAVDHVLQLVAVRRRRHGRFERDQPLHVQARERLVHRLHAEFFLSGLHRAVDLVNLVVANQVPDRRVRHHDLERADASGAVSLRHQRLCDDPFEHERQLRPDLRL